MSCFRQIALALLIFLYCSHRDVKPEKLLLASPSDDTSIRLAGFGFASSVHDGLLLGPCGTPSYTAPEVFKFIPYGTVRFGFRGGGGREGFGLEADPPSSSCRFPPSALSWLWLWRCFCLVSSQTVVSPRRTS